MTKLGKIFTAILLGLSVMFFGVAIVVNATHVDYGDTLNDPTLGLKAIAQREQKRVSELTDMVAKQKEEILIETAARRAALASLQVQMEQLQFELTQKENEYAQKRTELTQTVVTEQASQEEQAARAKDVDAARDAMVVAKKNRDDQFQKLRQAYGQFIQLQGDYKTLQMQADQLTTSPSNVPSTAGGQ